MTSENTYLLREPYTVCHVNLFEPKAFKDKKTGKDKGEPKFQTTFLIPIDAEEIPAIKKAMIAVAKAAFPDRAMADLKFPLASGEKKAAKAKKNGKDGSYYLGNLVLTARTQYPPILNVMQGNNIITLETDQLKAKYKNKFYSGCVCAGEVKFVAYEGQDSDGVTAYLQSVLWVDDGERIGGRDMAEVYKGHMGKATSEDPLAEDDDDEGNEELATGAPTQRRSQARFARDLDDEVPF